MPQITIREQQDAQKKYRKKQQKKGLVRFELQVSSTSKKRFDQLVAAVAEEYAQPWGQRQRIAKARAQIFDEITQGITHDFFELKDQIEILKAEIKALSPTFFKPIQADQTPLPQAIQSLPDDAKQLKALLANLYGDAQKARLAAQEYQRQAKQFEELYKVSSDYNEQLKQQMKVEEDFFSNVE